MGFVGYWEKKIKKMGFLDVALLKMCLFVIGMIVGAYFSSFVIEQILIFAAVFVLTYLLLMYRLLKR
jgi:hypothetical protein